MSKQLVFLASLALRQEMEGVSFDPRETGGLTWEGGVAGVLFWLAVYGVWRLLGWWLESRRARIRWAALRRWLPPMMCAMACASLGAARLWPDEGEPVFLAVVLVNLPALLLLLPLNWLLDSAPQWLRAGLLLIGSWPAWYVVVRIMEWRAGARELVTLRLDRRE